MHLSVLSTRKRSGAESLATPSGISQAATSVVSCRSSVSGHRSSSSKHTRGQSRETGSLSRLFSSVETTAKCISLGPADCRERLSYSVRPFKGLFLTCMSPEQALVLEQEVSSLLRKEAIEVVPPLDRESGFYSRYFVVPKKNGGATSNFRSAATEPLSQAPEVQNAYCKTGRVSDQIRGLVRHDRSKRCLFPYIHPSQSQEVPEVCFQGQSLPISGSSLRPNTLTLNFHEVRGCCPGSSATPGHPHTQLHRRLVDFSSFRADQDVVLAQMKELGLRLNAKKSVLSPLQRTTYLGVVWDSTTMQARLSPARIESILTTVRRVREGLSLTVKQFQILLGLMAAASNVIPFGLLYMRPLQWWLKFKGFSPRGIPFRMIKATRRCLRALDMWRRPWFLSQGPVLGAPCRRVASASDGCIPDRLRGGHEWPPCPRSVEWSPSHVAHQLSGDAGRVSSTKTFSSGPKKSQCASTNRQHSCGFLYQPSGRSALAPLIQAGAPDPCVVPGQVPLAESSLYSWASQCRSRHSVEAGGEARGMEASPRGGEADFESFWPGTGGSVCDSSDIALSPLVLSDSSSSAGAGCYGTDVAEASSVHLSPDRSALGSSRESAPGRGPAVASSPVLAGPSMVLGPDFSPRRLSMGDSSQEGSPLTSGGYDPSPPPRVMEAVGVAPEGVQLIASGLSTEVVETILQSRAPSMRKLYGLKWRLFTSWCGDHQLDPVNCPVGTVLEFLQARFSAGLSHSTLRVYVAAIASYHAPMGGQSVGKNPLITRFLRGVMRLFVLLPSGSPTRKSLIVCVQCERVKMWTVPKQRCLLDYRYRYFTCGIESSSIVSIYRSVSMNCYTPTALTPVDKSTHSCYGMQIPDVCHIPNSQNFTFSNLILKLSTLLLKSTI